VEDALSATISPDRILKELSDLWVSMGKEGQAESGAGVLRACSMTLIVLAEEADDPSSLGETVAALMPEHPARTVTIRLCSEGERALSERVYAQCWMPFGQRRQICCEQVEISGRAAAGRRGSARDSLVPDSTLVRLARVPPDHLDGSEGDPGQRPDAASQRRATSPGCRDRAQHPD
jgi:hypothetical protein